MPEEMKEVEEEKSEEEKTLEPLVFRTLPIRYKRKAKKKEINKEIGRIDVCINEQDIQSNRIKYDFNMIVHQVMQILTSNKLGVNHQKWNIQVEFDENGPVKIFINT